MQIGKGIPIMDGQDVTTMDGDVVLSMMLAMVVAKLGT